VSGDESESDRQRTQRERALQSWELAVLEPPDDALVETLRRVLHVKRFDLPALRRALPGVVRRGARVDLEALEAGLREAGVSCALRRRGESEAENEGESGR